MSTYKFVIEVTSEQPLTEHEVVTIQETYANRIQGYYAKGRDISTPIKVTYGFDRKNSDVFLSNEED